jgi:Fic family protein
MINLEAYAALPIIEQIYALRQQIDSLRPISPEQEQRILQKYRLDWNYHSNAIEGNSLTYGETRAFLMHGLTAKGKPLKDHLDIRGHNQAVDFIYRMIKEETEITEADIRSLHEVILVEPYEVDTKTGEGIPAKKRIQLGVYKNSPNHVLTKTGEIHYYATPEDTPILMGELMEVYRQNKANPVVHPFVLAAYFHYRFTAIHPFDDGNGRMARLMMNLLLMKAGYPPVIIRQEKANREAYYYALSQADAGEYISFFELIGEALVHSMELYVKGAKGESLEEPDDLDKELALLKREMETQGTVLEKRKSGATLVSIKDNVILPLKKECEAVFSKFAPFFIENTIHIFYYNKKESSVINSIDTINKIPFEFDELSPIEQVIIYYDFRYFKKQETPFSINWSLTFTFELLGYIITIAPSISAPEHTLSPVFERFNEDKNVFACNPHFLEVIKTELVDGLTIVSHTHNLFSVKKPYHMSLSTKELKEINTSLGNSFLHGVKFLQENYDELLNYDIPF